MATATKPAPAKTTTDRPPMTRAEARARHRT